jgi:hypothetical protein
VFLPEGRVARSASVATEGVRSHARRRLHRIQQPTPEEGILRRRRWSPSGRTRVREEWSDVDSGD